MNLIAGSIVEISYKKMYVNKPFKEKYTFEADIYKPLLSQDMHTAIPNYLPRSLAPATMGLFTMILYTVI